jgi:hypothetical protein
MISSQNPAAGTLLAAPESIELVVSTGIPTWAIASLLLLVGSAAGFLIRGHTQKLPNPPSSPEQTTIQWSTRAHKDLGFQQVEAGEMPVGVDIRVRPIIDHGTQKFLKGGRDERFRNHARRYFYFERSRCFGSSIGRHEIRRRSQGVAESNYEERNG